MVAITVHPIGVEGSILRSSGISFSPNPSAKSEIETVFKRQSPGIIIKRAVASEYFTREFKHGLDYNVSLGASFYAFKVSFSN